MTQKVLPTRPMVLDSAAAHHVLLPGDVVCAEQGDHLETLLGSCVAVLLSDPRGTVGAMCHIVHAAGDPGGQTTFAAAALQRMHEQLLARGIVYSLCQAWVCGGGNMFPGRYAHRHVGEANAQWVLQALAGDGVQLVGQDLGGPFYRRVHWKLGDPAPCVTRVNLDL